MQYIRLGKSDLCVSKLGLGCIDFGTVTDKKKAFQLIEAYLEEGGNLLDTANNYAVWHGGEERASEKVIGAYLRQHESKRNEIVLCTKLGALPSDKHKGFDAMQGNSRKVILEEVNKSLEALQISYIDLLYLHVDDYQTELEETLEALNEVIGKGYVRHIGCSNFRTWRIEKARTICERKKYPFFSAVQQRYSYLQPVSDADFGVQVAADNELKDYLQYYQDLTMVAHTSLLYGTYVKKQIQDIQYQTKANEERLRQLKKMGENAAPWVLKYITEQFGGSVALFTTNNVMHLRENMRAI